MVGEVFVTGSIFKVSLGWRVFALEGTTSVDALLDRGDMRAFVSISGSFWSVSDRFPSGSGLTRIDRDEFSTPNCSLL